MRIANDNLWLCLDCTLAAVNDDTSSLDYYYDQAAADARREAITAGLERLGFLSKGNAEMGFSSRPCDCCASTLTGERHHFMTIVHEAG